ncbi:MAG: DUF1611 domain-containing protein [Candidatus Neomarinimicrobiota bacterium]|nr:DUF1611 domain-containing protein [Candidatus Neomarinimicrobiota bacterium]
MKRYAVLAIGAFDYILNKTGNMLIRYCPDEVVAVVDPEKAGQTAEQVLGWGGEIPCVASFLEAAPHQPTHLVIGSAPQGGVLDNAHRNEIENAVKAGCHIISGMHVFLNDDEHLFQLASEHSVTLTDLRCPPNPPHFPKGSWKERKYPVLLVVGSDCDTGKMTTAWELTQALRKRNHRVEFIGTGQTGILLSGKGVPIDAVVGDFMAGEIEYCLDQLPSETELAVVEGQGALNNSLYSGVTFGLLHGCMPDFLVFTHEPGRELDVSDHPFPELNDLMILHIDAMKPFKKSEFLGMNFLTLKLYDELALETCNSARDQYGMPVTDLVRFGGKELIDAIETEMGSWN